MKTKLLSLLTIAAFATFAPFARNLQAAEKSFLDGITLSPVGAYKQAGFTHGPGTWGAGADLGLPINKFVSIHVRNLAFENDDRWGGSVVDETTLYGRADFVSFAAEKFRLFGTGGGSRHWDSEEWSFGVGLGAEYRFTKNIAASLSREIRAYTQGTSQGSKDWLTVAALTFKF